MAILSKPLTLHCTCYELGHCWTPYCLQATKDVAKNVFKEAIKIYGTLYLITALLRKRGWSYYIKKFAPETLRSTLFLTVNGSLFIALFCIWRKLCGFYIFYNTFVCGIPACALSIVVEQKCRHLLGCFTFLNSSFLPAYLAAAWAVLLERKNRRGPLAVYLTNLAVETGFRMLVNRGLVTPINNGEVILFSLASAVYLYLFRRRDGLPPVSRSIFRFLLGSEENPDAVGENDSNSSQAETISTSDNHDNNSSSKRHISSSDDGWRASIAKIPGVPYLRQRALALLQLIKGTARHPICPHRHGCLHYVVTGLLKMFGVGFLAQTTIKLMSSMSLLRRRPSQVLRSLVSMHNMGLGAFLGLYCALFRAVNCALRWLRGEDSAAHGFVGGLTAGVAMIFYKSITVSLYSCAKLMEILYFKGIESGHLPHIPWADVLIYAFSTAFVFHAAIFEPHALRSAYWKFLLRVTDGKFAGMNRRLLDGFGTKSSQLYPNYWPQYDTRFTQLSPATDLSSLYR